MWVSSKKMQAEARKCRPREKAAAVKRKSANATDASLV